MGKRSSVLNQLGLHHSTHTMFKLLLLRTWTETYTLQETE